MHRKLSHRKLSIAAWFSACLMTTLCAAAAPESLPAGLQVKSLSAFPAKIELHDRFDYRQLVLTGELTTGETVDLTRMAKLTEASDLVQVSELGLVSPRADGNGQLVFRFDQQSIQIPIRVTGINAPRPVSFVNDVQPALSRMSCNAGTCHGAKDGKNGFKLSLRGYDSLYDHRAFTDDVGARRINRAAPDQSLMLLKATGVIPHVGGVRTQVGSPYYQIVRQWIADSAQIDLDAPRVTAIEVFPKDPILPRANMRQQMSVLATYADGKVRDVTREAFIESGNIEVIEAGDDGVLTVLRRGEAPVLVRYEGAYAATTLTVMGDRSGFEWKTPPPANNYIDDLVYQKLKRVKILPSELCSDNDFLRRVYIDLTGLPPTPEQVHAFLSDGRESKVKRDELIDTLIGSSEYIEHWTNKWADLLQVNRKFLGEEGAVALRNWIKQAVASNQPYDQLVREVLTASGSTLENPPAAYYKILRDPADLMENTTHLFLAVRFNCNKCHDHPFERWTQNQYYELAAYFAQIGRKEAAEFRGKKIGGSAVEGAKPLVEVVFDSNAGEIKHDRTGQTTAPAFPYRHEDVLAPERSRREQLAHWITSSENQYFARSYVNRLWGYLFGTGIIEPIDDIRAGNPPTNPELLNALEKDFVDHQFDVQHMLRTICKSRVYQHSIVTNEWNEDDTINYSHAIPRRLTAEALYDAIHLACGAQQKIPGVPPGFRAAELPDAGIKVPFLDDFGKPVRESACECERSSSMVLGPIMKLINGPTVANAIADPANALTQLESKYKDDDELIRQVFLRFLARMPSDKEVSLGKEALATAGAEHQELVARLNNYRQTLPEKLKLWEQNLSRETTWTVLDVSEFKSAVGAEFKKQADQSVLVTGKRAKDTYTVVATTDLTGITGIRLEALADQSLKAGGPGRAENGNFVLNELTLNIASTKDPSQMQKVALGNASADFSQQSWDVAGAVDGNPNSGWAVSPAFGKNHTAIFETQKSVGDEGGSQLTFLFSQQFSDGLHSLGKFRLSVTQSPRPLKMGKLPDALAAILAVPEKDRNDQQRQALLDAYRKTDRMLTDLEAQVNKSAEMVKNKRLLGVQDLAWALINNPSFLFNR